MLKRIFLLAALLGASVGCGPMTQMNREGLGIVLDQNVKAQKSVVDALKATKDLVDELKEAAAEEREPDLATPLVAIVESLDSATKSIDEIGETVVVLQEGIGAPEKAPPQTPEDLEAWRNKYMVLAKMIEKAKNWLNSKLPIPAIAGFGAGKKPQPWSTAETTGLIATIIAAIGGSGIGGKKLLDRRKAQKETKAEAEEARSLLAELREELEDDQFEKLLAEKKQLRVSLEKLEHEKRLNEV